MDWEARYQQQDTPWDKGQASPPLLAWLSKQKALQGRALVPGCGLGHDAALLATAGLNVTGLDISATAVRRAQALHDPLPITWLCQDLFSDSIGAEYDWVFEHTCLCALQPDLRQTYERAVHQRLRPGGRLVGVWFIQPDLAPGESGPPFGISIPELDALFPTQHWQVVEDIAPVVAYPGRDGRERLRVLEKRAAS
jgi:methyl halide transferase